MVTAGIKKSNIQGEMEKNGLKSAKPESKILYSPLNIHKNNPFRIRKIAITKKPIGEPKKDLISLNNNAFIKC